MPKEKKLPSKKVDGRTLAAKRGRITKEETRLTKILENLPPNLMNTAQGLIRRAAYMRITLEDYEKDLDENGTVELFQQSINAPPYERERPVARLYNTLNGSYQKIIKQLTELQPKEDDDNPKPAKAGDGFAEFVAKKTN